VSDRNRGDLGWTSGSFRWRYRNLFQIERRIAIHSYHPAPYLSVEFFYQSRYRKWSETAIYAGCLFPMGKHIELDPYYEHQNNTGRSPNQQLNDFLPGIFLGPIASLRRGDACTRACLLECNVGNPKPRREGHHWFRPNQIIKSLPSESFSHEVFPNILDFDSDYMVEQLMLTARNDWRPASI